MTITVETRYYGVGTVYYEAESDDEPNIVGKGSTPDEAVADLKDKLREEYHPDRTPLRLHKQEAEFQKNHVRES